LARSPQHASCMRTTALRMGTIAVAASCLVASLGCYSGNAATPPSRNVAAPMARGGGPRSGAGRPLPFLRAIDTVTKESCAHEQKCDRMGAGRRFATLPACESAMEHTTRRHLAVCESGYVESDALLDCIETIRSGACGMDLEAACRFGSMCSP